MSTSAFQSPHRRYNPLRKQWVLVSPHRTQRPWQGEVNTASGFSDIHYDPACYLCPGNERAGGARTPVYENVYVFDNDYAALLPDSPAPETEGWPSLLKAERERGLCRVLCFHADHSLTLARMQPYDIRLVVEAWATQYAYLGRMHEINYVQIFENRGAMMGASNPHPHGQIWATEHVPDEPAVETAAQLEYHQQHGSCLLCDYLKVEQDAASSSTSRIVCENEGFLTVVPWWAVWPFETLVLSKSHLRSLDRLQRRPEERSSPTSSSRRPPATTISSPPASPTPWDFHQSPTDGQAHDEWHFHAHFYPPLLRSATVRKFMVGFECLGMPQRDITPESAAERLRALPAEHFTDQYSAES